MLFTLLGFPLAVVSAAGVLLATYAGGLLSLSLVGLPVLAAGLRGVRLLGTLHRALVNSLLGGEIDSPPPLARPRRVVPWVQSSLADVTGWRTAVYLLVRLPVAVVGVLALLGLPALSVWLLGANVWLLTTQQGGASAVWDLVAAVLIGSTVLAATPHATQATVALNVWLARVLLSPTTGQRQLHELRRARSRTLAEHARSLRQIERDLHDGTQAELVAIAMTLALAADAVESPDGAQLERGRALVARARAQTDAAMAELRRLITGISPAALDNGLPEALQGLTLATAIPVALTVDLPERPDEFIERVAYFCVGELLTNIAKHSGADRAVVRIRSTDDELRITVADDGGGGARIGAGSGLLGLRERLTTVDGLLLVHSPAGGPTTVEITLPLRV